MLRIILGLTEGEAVREMQQDKSPTETNCSNCSTECWVTSEYEEFLDRLGEDAFTVLCWDCTIRIGDIVQKVSIVNVQDALGSMGARPPAS